MANLIGFDKNRENVEFKGPCKLSVNFVSNYLFVEPKNEEFKLISSSFEWKYFIKKNLLFVFADFNFLDFCLEFQNEQVCKKIFDSIVSAKKDITQTNDPNSIDNSFIRPIFFKIADNPALNSLLINVMAKWMQLLDEEDKEKYMELMKEYGIFDLISDDIQSQVTQRSETNIVEEKMNRKRNFFRIKKEEKSVMEIKKTIPTMYSKIIPSAQFKLIYVFQLRQRRMLIFNADTIDLFHQYKTIYGSKNNEFKCITCDKKAFIDIDENGEICVKMDSKKHSCKPSTKFPENYKNIKFIQKPDYEIFENCAGKCKKILVLFDPADKNYCYEYSWNVGASKFLCRGCCIKTYSNVSKARIRNEGTEKEYVEIYVDHHCEKRKYSPEKYAPVFDYVLKPDFEIQKYCRCDGKEVQKLIIYDASDKTKYYQYFYHSRFKKFICCICNRKKKFVTAKLHQNSENEEYIILSNAKHVCEMRSLISTDTIILGQPKDFEIMGETKIFVFGKNDRKSGHVFYSNRNLYLCLGCSTIRKHKKVDEGKTVVTGKLSKINGKYNFEMKPNQIHCCKTRPYQPEKYEIQILQKTSDFFYYRLKSQPKTVKLAIQSAENNQLCFTFVYEKGKKEFSLH